jgi:hypothetical protein
MKRSAFSSLKNRRGSTYVNELLGQKKQTMLGLRIA